MKRKDVIIGAVAVMLCAGAVAAILMLALALNYGCVHHVAPWMLGTRDPVAVAIYCKPT